MSKVTDIKRGCITCTNPSKPGSDYCNECFELAGPRYSHIAASPTPEDCFLISQPSHQVLLTREQAEFVLPHLQRWLTGDRG